MAQKAISRKELAKLLNEDLAREYQAIIAYVVYSQVLKGAEYMNIVDQLEQHAKQELEHALTISRQIDYLGEMPTATPKAVKLSDKPRETRPFATIGSESGNARRSESSPWPSRFARSSCKNRIIRSTLRPLLVRMCRT